MDVDVHVHVQVVNNVLGVVLFESGNGVLLVTFVSFSSNFIFCVLSSTPIC